MPDWDQRYKTADVGASRVADVLMGNQHLLTDRGQALDYACGLAANGLWLESRGYHVQAWDNSRIAINKLNDYSRQHQLNLTAQQIDLEQEPFDPQPRFDLVVCSFFLHRPGLSRISKLLKPGGLLFYQTFCGEQLNGRGPSSPDYRLKTGELLQQFSHMQIVYYREDGVYGKTEQSLKDQALLVAANL